MSIPDSPYLLDFINPEFILLKMLARGLIMWDYILPTKSWIEQFVPQSIQRYCLVKPKPGMANPDLETIKYVINKLSQKSIILFGIKNLFLVKHTVIL